MMPLELIISKLELYTFSHRAFRKRAHIHTRLNYILEEEEEEAEEKRMRGHNNNRAFIHLARNMWYTDWDIRKS